MGDGITIHREVSMIYLHFFTTIYTFSPFNRMVSQQSFCLKGGHHILRYTFPKWNSREAEIPGWQAYIYDLTVWAIHASLEFGSEIEHACRWPDPLHWNQLAVPHRARSRRLLAILRSAFGNHPRTLTLINAFSEGIYLCNADVGVNAQLQASNGFIISWLGGSNISCNCYIAENGPSVGFL